MLEFLKSKLAKVLLILLVVGGLIGFGQWFKHERLEDKVITFETRFNEISEDLDEEIEELDTLGMKEQKKELIALQEDVQKQAKRYRENSEERMMLNEFDISLGYYIEVVDLMLNTIDNPWGLLSGIPEQQLITLRNEIEQHNLMYKQYKEQLKIETPQEMNAELPAKEL